MVSCFSGRPSASATAPPKGLGMQLGKTQRTNQFLESLKAEGEVILEDVKPSAVSAKSTAPPPTDPVTLTVEEKLNVTLKRDGGVSNFDVQGMLSLQILNQEDGLIQVQVALPPFLPLCYMCLCVYKVQTLSLNNPFYVLFLCLCRLKPVEILESYLKHTQTLTRSCFRMKIFLV